MDINLEAKAFFYDFPLQGKKALADIREAGRQLFDKIAKIAKIFIKFFKTEASLGTAALRSITRLIRRKGDHIHSDTDKKVLTVFIHGFMSNVTAFAEYDEHFQNKCNILRVNISNTLKTIEECTEEVQDKINRYFLDEGQSFEINLVGHSMGGIIAANFAETYHAENFTIKNVVALGSPFKGTPHASEFSFIPSVNQMQPNSPFLARLVSKMIGNQHVKYHFACSGNDSITPRDSAIPFGQRHHKIAEKGHLCLLYDQEIKSWVVRCLGLIDKSPYA